ncbi:MAG TPA: hypothetical protein DCR35_18550 [Runella sp.]|nr:hypothetical protein [Runella sp.]HAO51124.1 hypothetical protein [Runella sp.]
MNIHALSAQFELQTSWFLNALEDITDDESNIQFTNNLNPIKWVAGHLLNTRFIIVNILTGRPKNKQYQVLFGKGTTLAFKSELPTIEEIKFEWLGVSTSLMIALKNAAEETLLSTPPIQTSIADKTLLGLVAYASIHENFHIGQLSILRKQIGKSAMLMNRREY